MLYNFGLALSVHSLSHKIKIKLFLWLLTGRLEHQAARLPLLLSACSCTACV